jgi:hypothetical protein
MAWADTAALHVTTPAILVCVSFGSGDRYYSTDYVRISTQSYKGNIVGLPQIASSIGDLRRTYERNKITIVFSDADYEFRGLDSSEATGFKTRPVLIQAGFAEDDYANLLTLFSGKIYDWRWIDGLRFELDIEESSRNMENEYPEKRVELTDYPYADGHSVGWVIPIPYGTISAFGAAGDGAFGHPSLTNEYGMLFVDTRTNQEKHLVGLQDDAITVDRVYKNGVLQTLTTHYTVTTSVVDGKTHTLIAWASGVNPTTADRISCDISFGSRRPVEAIRHFLLNYCGYVAGDFNATFYAAAQAKEIERGYTFDGALWQKAGLRTLLDTWRDEYELDIFWDKNGLVCFRYITAILPTGTRKYTDVLDILADHDSDPQVGQILNKLKYGYDFHYSKTYFYHYGIYESAASQAKWGAVFSEFAGFYWLRGSSLALDIASRKIVRRKDPITFDSIRLPLKSFDDNLADCVKISHFNGRGPNGYEEKLFQVRAQTFDIDGFVNTELLEDASNFAGNACILGDETTLPATWMAASGGERDYCYQADYSTEEFSDGEEGKRMFD